MDLSSVRPWSERVLGYMGGVITHVHTNELVRTCTGEQSLADVVALARAFGLQGVAVTNHATGSRQPNFDPGDAELEELRAHLEWIASQNHDLRVYRGLELNIGPDRLDIHPRALGIPGFHLAGEHGWPYDDPSRRTAPRIEGRFFNALDTPGVAGIAHPIRTLGDHWMAVDWEAICSAAANAGKVLELNFNELVRFGGWVPDSPGFKSWVEWLHRVAATKVRFVIGHDIHNLGMWPGGPSEESWAYQVVWLERFCDLLEAVGIGPDRIINATLEGFDQFINDRTRDT